jgi:hypothetical protein
MKRFDPRIRRLVLRELDRRLEERRINLTKDMR